MPRTQLVNKQAVKRKSEAPFVSVAEPGIQEIRRTVRQQANAAKAAVFRRFFKTAPGEYGAGDLFLGIPMPQLRKLVAQFFMARRDTVLTLLQSPYHEERMLALLIFIRQYAGGDAVVRQEIYEAYLDNTAFINNWDLIDVTAPHIIGAHLADKNRKILYSLAKSDSLWERRIAILSTMHFIRKRDFADALKISRLLRDDSHDLIHKAVGWMLREIGIRDRQAEELFLKEHYQKMPRTMLRYAIEKFPEAQRRKYLAR